MGLVYTYEMGVTGGVGKGMGCRGGGGGGGVGVTFAIPRPFGQAGPAAASLQMGPRINLEVFRHVSLHIIKIMNRS